MSKSNPTRKVGLYWNDDYHFERVIWVLLLKHSLIGEGYQSAYVEQCNPKGIIVSFPTKHSDMVWRRGILSKKAIEYLKEAHQRYFDVPSSFVTVTVENTRR